MSTIETPGPHGDGPPPDDTNPGGDPPDGVEIRTLSTAADMIDVCDVFRQVWGSATELIRLEMLMAISHSGGYVSAPYDLTRPAHGAGDGMIVGASVALLATHRGAPALHSHVTGILPGARSTGLGRTLKLHQQAWAAERGIEWIVWTFDPLVRRNAWFNIAVLGAEADEYLPNFYGTMTDAINAGDRSDRLLVAWRVGTDPTAPLRDGAGVAGTPGHDVIPTPDDIVGLRRTDPAAVERWRSSTRTAFQEALGAGRPIVAFTRAGEYVLGPSS